MIFNSFGFLCLFLPIVLGIFFALRRSQKPKYWLLAASLFFYATLDLKHLPLLLAFIIVNYALGIKILRTAHQPEKSRTWFILALALDLGLLIFCKYPNFVLETMNLVGHSHFRLQSMSFPLGISFFTIQGIAFLVDVYQDLIPQISPLNYALFIAFFPRVISGPILDYRETTKELDKHPLALPVSSNVAIGLMLLFIGLAKKVLIADNLAGWTSAGLAMAPSLTSIEAWVTVLCLTFQIYFDFSGYSDMAIGLARLFNIQLPNNFNSPFQATSIIDFWNRWHMTLTRFITSYLYTPILRTFKTITFPKAMVATFFTMLVVGLWHGPSWTFVMFGAIHGFAFIINHLVRRKRVRIWKPAAWLLTFLTVNAAFVFFYAANVTQAIDIFKGLIGLRGISLPAKYAAHLHVLPHSSVLWQPWHFEGVGYGIYSLPFLFAFIFLPHNSLKEESYFQPTAGRLVFLMGLMFLSLLNLNHYAQFIYVNF